MGFNRTHGLFNTVQLQNVKFFVDADLPVVGSFSLVVNLLCRCSGAIDRILGRTRKISVHRTDEGKMSTLTRHLVFSFEEGRRTRERMTVWAVIPDCVDVVERRDFAGLG